MKTTNLKTTLALLSAMLAGLYGCTQPPPAADETTRLHALPFNVVATGDSRADTASAATFSWVAGIEPGNSDPRMADIPVNALLEEAIRDTLQQKGYHQSPAAGQGDLVVRYVVALNDAAADRQLAEKYGMQADLGFSSPDPDKFEKGTLVIDITERHSGLSAWRSSLQGFAYLQMGEAERRQRIRAMVQRMLAGMPSRN